MLRSRRPRGLCSCSQLVQADIIVPADRTTGFGMTQHSPDRDTDASDGPTAGPTDPAPAVGGSWLHRRLAALAQRERQLEEIGTEPDPRFTWANERTFLAWNRTALALIAAGLAAAQFLRFNLHGLRLIVAVPLIVLGAVLALASYLHWEDSERAIRLKQPLRYSWMPRLLTGGIVVIALCGGILAIIDRIAH
jgi:putative membrane protein